MKQTPKHATRFWSKVAIQSASECWDWQACKNKLGYGSFSLGGRPRTATHVALELSGQPRPSGLMALHKCDNPKCVNPKHLYWGTDADNTADKVRRGRLRVKNGSQHPNSKLSDEQVREILLSNESQITFAERFGVSQGLISRIRRGEGWRHLGIEAVRKGHAKGCATGKAKITPEIVRAIRADNRLQRLIANEYGVAQTLVSQIKTRRLWKHVD